MRGLFTISVFTVLILAGVNISLLWYIRGVQRDYEWLLVHSYKQNTTSEKLLSSLGSCRDTLDAVVIYNQAIAMETTSQSSRDEMEFRRKRAALKKKPFKPYYILAGTKQEPPPPDQPAASSGD
jgi:hypothetical protein